MSQKINPKDIPCEILPSFKLNVDLDPVTLFDFVDQIGQGYLIGLYIYILMYSAFGTVWKAKEKSTDTIVALKV
jgi:hypothetical protein